MQKNKPCIAIDAMGGDFGPSVVVRGALDALRSDELKVILVGREAEIRAELEAANARDADVEIVHAEQVIEMQDKPSDALRRKKSSSIQIAFRLVKEGRADGVVSAGNSGATLACGMFTLGRIEGIDRPALAGILPTEKKPMVLIDVGANVDCKPHNLVQFALMADVLARSVLGVAKPRIGLMSIGEEEGKGNYQVKLAYDMLRKSSLNFKGNVEGRDVFTGDVDVVVCDGFVGNVVLKLSEGLALSLGRLLKRELLAGFWSRCGTLFSKGALRRFSRRIDYAEYGGAPLLGLKGIGIVCHGASNAKALNNAIHMAATFVKNRSNDHLLQELSVNRDLVQYRRSVQSSSASAVKKLDDPLDIDAANLANP
ncbi:phosphate:acyl-[acyl carrier protein] acyltransferase [Desulfonatronum thiosulfatophilum]|uniref:Phosphate acyltransferase n=1 Tax=Desulfonatronum thiosulfatophilum TaxID=617002 RepID=A0A1G6DWX1_9BACT|nr:phosphate acyltransferase PlsX [Desulfonatronum thiosulfatophilum]SDB49687.1 phosphate:acyl-[acyl carrier protein] acyltransferase [Desulfonatronum thiosulfatophilum]